MQSAAPTPAAPAARPPEQQREALRAGRRVLRLFLYQRELTPIVITIGLFAYFTIRAGSTFTGSLSLSSAAGYAGPIGAIAVGEVLLLVLAEIDLSAGQVFLFAPWVEYWLHTDGVPIVPAIIIAAKAGSCRHPSSTIITAINEMLNRSGENAVSAKRACAFISAIITAAGPAKAR